MARQTSYTVHLPPPGRDADETIAFVPDSFSPIAFLAPWAWFPWNRMWIVTFAYLAAEMDWDFRKPAEAPPATR